MRVDVVPDGSVTLASGTASTGTSFRCEPWRPSATSRRPRGEGAFAEHLPRGPLSDSLVVDAFRWRLIEIARRKERLTLTAQPAAHGTPGGRSACESSGVHCYFDTSHALVAHTVGPDLVKLHAATWSLLAAPDDQG